MKKLRGVLLSCILLMGCMRNIGHRTQWLPWSLAPMDSTEYISYDYLNYIDGDTLLSIENRLHSSSGNGIDLRLPFGSDSLLGHSFPPEGFELYKSGASSDDSALNHQAALYGIWKYYLKLNFSGESDDYKVLPRIRSLNRLPINDHHQQKSDLFSGEFGSTIYSLRLSNIGKYEAYYVPEDDGRGGCLLPTSENYNYREACCFRNYFDCNAAGTLVLYDRETQHAMLMQIHYIFFGMTYEFFYITRNSKIRLFEGVGDVQEDASREARTNKKTFSLLEMYQIRVKANGDVERRIRLINN